jgi:Leucine-rich repeat (LRR) protein
MGETQPIDRAAEAGGGGDDDDDADVSTSYRGQNLRDLPPGFLNPRLSQPPISLSVLDLSGNELGALPGLDALAPTLTALRLSRNWFTAVPVEVASLKLLAELDLSRNFVRGSDEALQVASLQQLPRLRKVDLRYNRKCFKQSQADHLAQQLPHVVGAVPLESS